MAWHNLGRHVQAFESLSKALVILPEEVQLQTQLAEVRGDAATPKPLCLDAPQDEFDAQGPCSQFEEQDLGRIIEALYAQSKFGACLDCCLASITQNPKDSQMYARAVDLLIQLGHLSDARQVLLTSVTIAPNASKYQTDCGAVRAADGLHCGCTCT